MEFIKPENKDERIHAICNYLQAGDKTNKKCENCPESYYSEEAGGQVQRGCYAIAHETYRVALTGKWWEDKNDT